MPTCRFLKKENANSVSGAESNLNSTPCCRFYVPSIQKLGKRLQLDSKAVHRVHAFVKARMREANNEINGDEKSISKRG